MLITKPAIQALMTTFSTRFRSAYDETPEFSSVLVTDMPSGTKLNTYGFMTRILKMREWIGPRRLQNLNTKAYVLQNKTYENTIAVDVNDIEDDNLGVYGPMMSELGRTGRKWKDQLVKAALQAGEVELGFDDQPFFSTTHDINPAADQSNLHASTPLTAENYNVVRTAMISRLGEDGEPLGVMPGVIVVPPQLELTAKQILNSAITEVDGVSAPNHLAGTASIVVIPELANEPATWYLADNSKGIRGLIFQNRQAPTLTQKTALTDDCVFEDDQFRMGLKARGAAGYGVWFLMDKAKASA